MCPPGKASPEYAAFITWATKLRNKYGIAWPFDKEAMDDLVSGR